MQLDLCDLIEDGVALQEERAHQLRLCLTLELQRPAPRPAPIHGHPGQLRQLLHNLIVNAFQFSSSGGELRLSLTVQAGQLQLRVDDQGPGIACSIAEAHRGSLTALEAPGGGCRMLVQLPSAA